MLIDFYISKAGKRFSKPLEDSFHVQLNDKGEFTISCFDGVKERGECSFPFFKDVNSYMKIHKGSAVNPESLDIIAYFEEDGKTPSGPKGSKYSVVPEDRQFVAYRRTSKGRNKLETGQWHQCVSAIKSHAKRQRQLARTEKEKKASRGPTPNTIYKDATGAPCTQEEQHYRFRQYANGMWDLHYTYAGKDIPLKFAQMKECVSTMFAHIEEARKAWAPKQQEPVKIPEAASEQTNTPKGVSTSGSQGSLTNDKSRKKASAVDSRYFNKDLKYLGQEYVAGAKYRVYKTDKGPWRAGEYSDKTERSNWIDYIEFADEADATAYLYLYVGSTKLEFFNDQDKPCNFSNAVKCLRTLKDGTVETQTFDGYSWNTVEEDEQLAIPATPVQPDSGVTSEDDKRYTYYGPRFYHTFREKATYREYKTKKHRTLWVRDGDGWKWLYHGTHDEMYSFKGTLIAKYQESIGEEYIAPAATGSKKDGHAESRGDMKDVGNLGTQKETEKDPEPNATRVRRNTVIASKVWESVKNTTWLKEEYMWGYITNMAIHNRCSGQSGIFDTRLYDNVKQPIYLVDTDWGRVPAEDKTFIKDGCLQMCSSLAEAKLIRSDITDLPKPLQFSDDLSNYFWDPTTPLAPITAHALEHIIQDRNTRFPDKLQGKKDFVLMDIIRHAAVDGAFLAARDPLYALPVYSIEHDDVTLMLPVYLPYPYEDEVIAALILRKWATGYRVTTILEPEQACESVSLFRDPRTTWLKEVYENGQTVD